MQKVADTSFNCDTAALTMNTFSGIVARLKYKSHSKLLNTVQIKALYSEQILPQLLQYIVHCHIAFFKTFIHLCI